MNIFVRLSKDNYVEFIHLQPFDPVNGMGLTRSELLKQGVFVKEVPEPENKVGMRAIAKYNSDTKSIEYEYKPIPLSTKERIDNMENAFNELLMSNL